MLRPVEAEEGALPVLVIEVVSPRYAGIDHVDKVRVYRQARVAEYLIVDITAEARREADEEAAARRALEAELERLRRELERR